MSEDKKPNEAWRTQVPDFMIAAIDNICDTRDEIRKVHEALTLRTMELNDREQMIRDREKAIVDAAADMKAFANRIYGPDSELTKINQKLGGIEAASVTRDARYARQFQEISDNQTRMKDSFVNRFEQVESRVRRLEERTDSLEKSA